MRGLTEEQAEKAGIDTMSNYIAGFQKPTESIDLLIAEQKRTEPMGRLIAEQKRTNELLALQVELLMSLLNAANDGWCDTSAERNRLEQIMGRTYP